MRTKAVEVDDDEEVYTKKLAPKIAKRLPDPLDSAKWPPIPKPWTQPYVQPLWIGTDAKPGQVYCGQAVAGIVATLASIEQKVFPTKEVGS